LSLVPGATSLSQTDLYRLVHEINFYVRDGAPGLGSKYLTIDNSLDIRCKITYSLAKGNSSFDLVVFNLAQDKYEAIVENSIVEIRIGYSSLFGSTLAGFVNLGRSRRVIETVFIGMLDSKGMGKERETAGDMTFRFSGIDLAAWELERITTYNRNFGTSGSGVTDASVVVTELCNKSPEIQIGKVDNIGHEIPSYTMKKGDNGRSVVAKLAKKYGMYFICRKAKVWFVRDLDSLNELLSVPTINFDNALVSFDDGKKLEPVSVHMSRFVTEDSVKRQIVETGEIERTVYNFVMLGVPFVNVGNKIKFQIKEDLIKSKSLRVLNPLQNLRVNSSGIDLTIYSINIHYENQFNGFKMSGIAIEDKTEFRIQTREFDDSVDAIADEIGEIVDQAVQGNLPDVAEVTTEGAETGQVSAQSGTTEYAASDEIDDEPQGDLQQFFDVPQLVPYAGPGYGMVMPFWPGARIITQPLRGNTNPFVVLGQWWREDWERPATVPGINDSFIVQHGEVLNVGGVLKPGRVGRVEIDGTGRIGIRGTGFAIKIDPTSGNSTIDFTGSDGAVFIQVGATTLKVESTGVTIT